MRAGSHHRCDAVLCTCLVQLLYIYVNLEKADLELVAQVILEHVCA